MLPVAVPKEHGGENAVRQTDPHGTANPLPATAWTAREDRGGGADGRSGWPPDVQLHPIRGRRGIYAWIPDLPGLVPLATLRDGEVDGATSVLTRAEDACRRLVEMGIVRDSPPPPPPPVLTRSQLEELLSRGLWRIGLVPTTRCNLRCRYCRYSGGYADSRSHGTEDMSFDVARAALAMLHAGSADGGRATISFYGGEPLANLPLIRYVVQQARSLFPTPPQFVVATNGTLIGPGEARFLVSEGFQVQVSIDGPPWVHDRYRRTGPGHASFDRAYRGLRALYEVSPAFVAAKVSLAMVIAPPFEFEAIDDFLATDPIIGAIRQPIFLPVSRPNEWFFTAVGVAPELEAERWESVEAASLDTLASERALRWALGTTQACGITRDFCLRLMELLRRRTRGRVAPLQAICIPGHKKSMVDPDGTLRICERVGDTQGSVIGHVSSGFDVDRIHRLLEDWAAFCGSRCVNCWARGLCGTCFSTGVQGASGVCVPRLDACCPGQRRYIERMLAGLGDALFRPGSLAHANLSYLFNGPERG